MALTYSWWSESGGPGKTTNCVHTAAAMGRDGYDVLAVDLDNQRGGLTHYMGYGELTHDDGAMTETTIMDVMFGEATPRDICVETPHFDLLPTHEDLTNFISRLDSSPRRGVDEFRVVRDMLDTVEDDYDIIVIDCKATLDELVDNSLFATQNVMVPLELTPKGKASQEGLEATVTAMHDGFSDLGVEIAIAGCVPSRVGQANIFERYREQHQDDGVPVSPFAVPEHSLLKYTWHHRMDLFSFIVSDETRNLREYEEHVPLAFKVIGRLMSGDMKYEDAVSIWDEVKDREMGDATPKALLDEYWDDKQRAGA